jgi:hypothetical protein
MTDTVNNTRNSGPRPPSDLGPEGKKLWKAVVREYGLRVDETAVLHQSCKVLDQISVLENEIAASPIVVRGSQGQPVVNSLIQECRLQRAEFGRLMRQLALPDLDAEDDAGAMARTERARRAALSRWDRDSSAYWQRPA